MRSRSAGGRAIRQQLVQGSAVGTLSCSAGIGAAGARAWLLFSIPAGLSGWALFAYATGISILLRVAHSAYFLPYVGLGAELSDDYAERTNVVSSRFLFSVVGAVACLLLGQAVYLSGPAA